MGVALPAAIEIATGARRTDKDWVERFGEAAAELANVLRPTNPRGALEPFLRCAGEPFLSADPAAEMHT